MASFSKNEISLDSEEAGRELRAQRKRYRLSLAETAAKISIQVEYLLALEEGRPDRLPPGLYGEHFLLQYADFLGLDGAYLSQKFGFKQNQITDNNPFIQKVPSRKNFISMPGIIRIAAVSALVLVCVLYISLLLKNILSAPELVIIHPAQDLTTEEQAITISGRTEAGATVSINETPVLADRFGNFSLEVHLKSGVNTIVVNAQKKYSSAVSIARKIIVK